MSNTSYSSISVNVTGINKKEFSSSQKLNISNDTFNIVDIDINDIIKKTLKSYNDASLNHVDISGELMTKNIHVKNTITFY